MIITIGTDNLYNLLKTQLKHNFASDTQELSDLEKILPIALEKISGCFNNIDNKYFKDNNDEAIFNPFHSSQNAIFLYFLSRTAWEFGSTQLADKIFYLNKMLNACDIFYEVELPAIFLCDHPLGTIIGRATFGNFLVIQQNCTIGGNYNAQQQSVYPVLGEYVWMFANSMVIGNSIIGNNVFISANTYIKDENIPDNTIVFGQSPNLILKQKPASYFYGLSQFRLHKEMLDNFK